MKSLASIIALLAVTVAFAQGGQTNHPAVNMSEKIFDPARDSAKDIADAVKLATKENKHILLDVGGNWCPWCHKLDSLFNSDKDIATLLKQYVVVKVDFSQGHENKEVLAKYPKVAGYPHLFVIDKSGKLIQSQDTGKLESGDHHDPAKVTEFLKKYAK